MRRLVGAVRALLVGGVVITLLTVGAPPAGAAVVFRTFQLNIAHIFKGAPIYIARHDPPLTIAVQEACSSTLNDLVDEIAYAEDYRWHRYNPHQKTSHCAGFLEPPAYGYFSMAFSKGVWASAPNLTFGPFPNQDPGDWNRGYICISASFGRTWWSCSTHLASKNGYYTALQSEYMADVSRFASASGRAAITGGDFNRTPGQNGMATWYSGHHEVDNLYRFKTFNRKASLDRKYDYIFSTGLLTDAAFQVARIGCAESDTGSDHCFVHGTNRFLT